MSGKLIIGGFDIGNTRDISPRMMDAILKADLILTESIEVLNQKCDALNLKPRGQVVEYNYLNQTDQNIIDLAIDNFKMDKTVMITSDDGMPGICDPGSLIIRAASLCNTRITSVPGPSILSTLPAMSGLNTKSFRFQEHLPVNREERLAVLKKAKDSHESFMFIIANRIGENALFKDILDDICTVYRKHAMVAVGINITMPSEFFIVNTIHNVIQAVDKIEISDHSNISVFINWVP
jgi:16S rRNA C1402 (ribose-2'-O) methylase RsmI